MSFMTEEEMLHRFDDDPRFTESHREGYYSELAREAQIKAGFAAQQAGLFGMCINDDLSEEADFHEAEAHLLQNIANSYAMLSEMYAHEPYGNSKGYKRYYEYCENNEMAPYNPMPEIITVHDDGDITAKGFDTLGMSKEQEEAYRKYEAGEITQEEYIKLC